MRILFEPIFIQNERQEDEHIYRLNEILTPVEGIIIDALRSSTYLSEPERVLTRMGNYYTISTIDSEDTDNANVWLNNINVELNTTRVDNVSINVVEVEGTINTTFMCTSMQMTPNDLVRFQNNSYIFGNKEDIEETGRNFSQLNQEDLNLNNVIFYNSLLAGAKFDHSSILNSTFTKCALDFADFSHALLNGSSLTISTLRGVNFKNADLRGVDFTESNLMQADFSFCIFDENTNFTDCILNGAIFIGDDYENTIYTDSMLDANFYDSPDDGEQHQEDGDDFDGDDFDPDESDEEYFIIDDDIDDEIIDNVRILPALEIDPESPINSISDITYQDIIDILTPRITNNKLPISRMIVGTWYGISNVGNTPNEVWSQIGLDGKSPNIGTIFRCNSTPKESEGEGIVYESVPTCMAIHKMSQNLDFEEIFNIFQLVVGENNELYNKHDLDFRTKIVSSKDQLKLFSKLFYRFLVNHLGVHIADEPPDSWSHVYDELDARKKFARHAVFHIDEGIVHHQKLIKLPQFLLLIMLFLSELPEQVQVIWAQNYMREFITGYGAQLETFNPEENQPDGFIAGCINGNFEKLLFSIGSGIVHFVKSEVVQSQVDLKTELTGSLFEEYFSSVNDLVGPTIEGYELYIQNKPNINEDIRSQYLTLLKDESITSQIEQLISALSGGGRKRKSRNIIKTIKKINKKPHKWSLKYKKSINCRRPKGFSQRQYCKYGRNKNKTKKGNNKTKKGNKKTKKGNNKTKKGNNKSKKGNNKTKKGNNKTNKV